MKSVLLTRSVEDNNEIINKIKKLGNNNFNYLHCPLIEYRDLNFNPFILKGYTNIIITSKYAAKVLSRHNLDKNFWVVGKQSKLILENNGFKIKFVAQNIDDLLEHFPAHLYDQTIYLSSNEITCDLPEKINRQIIYNVTYLEHLPYVGDFKEISFVLLYSQNSAKTLVKLLTQNNLRESLQNSLVIAISLKVANIIRPFVKNVVYCDDTKYDSRTSDSIVKLLIDNAKDTLKV